jgi:hypothetical protein
MFMEGDRAHEVFDSAAHSMGARHVWHVWLCLGCGCIAFIKVMGIYKMRKL